jgi:hypothetical protein
MPGMIKRSVLPALVAACLGAACGGGLKYKVEDAAMDHVAPSERISLSIARRELEEAQAEKADWDKKLDAVHQESAAAEKERQQIQLELERAIADQELAVKTRDETRSNAADRAKEIADLGVKTADAKLDWLEQKRDWTKAARRAAEARAGAAAAKVEMEKARVAKQKKVKTREEVDVGKFEGQWENAASDFQSAREEAADEEKKTKDLEQRWQNLRIQHEKLKGA